MRGAHLSLRHAVTRAVREAGIPSISICVRVDGTERLHVTEGVARRTPERIAVEDQAYDLASVTKALAGATVAASLLEEGALDLDTPVARWFPHVDGRISIAHLLTHSSGIPAWNEFYKLADGAWGLSSTRTRILEAATRTPLEAEPGTQHRYSDIGFLILLAVLEQVGGDRIDHLFHDRVSRPSGVQDLAWGWPGAAATEHCPVRDAVVEGTVHDLNCAAMGGISSHAGLFGTARAVATLGERLMNAVASPETSPLPGRGLARLWALRGAGSHAGGWDRISKGYTSTGRFFPPDTVGHLGYTGTSLWVVPSRRTSVALLTNRVHPTDDKTGIREMRPFLHDAVAMALGWET